MFQGRKFKIRWKTKTKMNKINNNNKKTNNNNSNNNNKHKLLIKNLKTIVNKFIKF
jgi:hypothetical protein